MPGFRIRLQSVIIWAYRATKYENFVSGYIYKIFYTLNRLKLRCCMLKNYFAAIVLLLSMSAGSVYGQQVTWTGSISNKWNVAGNWLPARVPSGTDTALVAASAHGPVIIGAASCGALFVQHDTVTLLGNGNSLTLKNGLRISPGAVFNMGADTLQTGSLLTVGGLWQNQAGESGFLAGGNSVFMNNLLSVSTTGARETFWNLAVSCFNSAPVTLSDSLFIGKQLTLNSGFLAANIHPVVFAPTAVSPVVTTAGSILGQAVVFTKSSYSIVIPLADNNGAAQSMGLYYQNGRPEKFRLQYFRTNPTVAGYNANQILSQGDEICQVETTEYWKITSLTDDSAKLKVSLYWENNRTPRVPIMLKIANFQNQAGLPQGWKTLGGIGLGSKVSGYVISDVVLNAVRAGTPLALCYGAPLLPPIVAVANTCQNDSGQRTDVTVTAFDRLLNLNWYTERTGGAPFSNDSTLHYPVLVSDTLYVSNWLGGCESERQPVYLKVYQIPSFPPAIDTVMCLDGSTAQFRFQPVPGYKYTVDVTYPDTLPLSFTISPDSTFAVKLHSYAIMGVTMTAQNSGCSFTSNKSYRITGYAPPSAPLFKDTASCLPADLTLKVASASSLSNNTFSWYRSPAGHDSLPGVTGPVYTAHFDTTTTFYVAETVPVPGCPGPRSAVKAIVTGLPPKPVLVRTDTACISGSVKIHLAKYADTLLLYADSTSTVPLKIGSGTVISTPSDSVNTTYYIGVRNYLGCDGTGRLKVTVPVIPRLNISQNDTSVCSPRLVTLKPRANVPGGTFTWYLDSTSRNPIPNAGSVFVTPIVVSDSRFYVEYGFPNGCKTGRKAINIRLNPPLAAPFAAGDSVCAGASATLTASGAQAGESYYWFNTASDTTPVGQGSPLVVNRPATTRTLYVARGTTGCYGNRTAVTVRVYPVPPAPVVSADTACTGSSVTLTASGAPRGGSYLVFADSVTNTALQETFTGLYHTPALQVPTKYYMAVLSADGCTGPRTAVTAQVLSPPLTPQVRDTLFCGSQTVTLPAKGLPAGTYYRWYSVPAGGTALYESGTGGYTVRVSANTTYYVSGKKSNSCESARVPLNIRIDTLPKVPQTADTTVCTTGPFRFRVLNPVLGYTYYWYAQASGGSPLQVGVSPNFNTTLSGTTTLYVSAGIGAGAGCISQRVPVQVSLAATLADPVASAPPLCGPGTAVVTVTAAGNPSGYYLYATATATVPLVSSVTNTISIAGIAGTQNLYASYKAGTCESRRVAVPITVLPLPDTARPTDTTFCKTGLIRLHASSPLRGRHFIWSDTAGHILPNPEDSVVTVGVGGTQTFLVKVVNASGCESLPARLKATFHTTVQAPGNDTATKCNYRPNILYARSHAGDTYWNWYTAFDSPVPIPNQHAQGLPFFFTRTAVYYVSTVRDGCESQRSTIIVLAKDPPPKPIISDTIMPCLGSDSNLYVYFQNNFLAYKANLYLSAADTLAGRSIGYSDAIVKHPFSTPCTVYVTFTDNLGCESRKLAITVRVRRRPASPIGPHDTVACTSQLNKLSVRPGPGLPPVYYVWYSDSLRNIIGETTVPHLSYYTDSSQTNDTIYVSCRNEAFCLSRPIKIIVHKFNTSVPQARDIKACAGAGSFLEVLNPDTNYRYEWRNAGDTLLGTGIRPGIALPVGHSDYYLRAVKGSCSSTAKVVDVNIVPSPVIDSVYASPLCGPGRSTILISGSGATSYTIYDSATGALVATTNSGYYISKPLSVTAKYYATAHNGTTCETGRFPFTVYVLSNLLPNGGPSASSCNGLPVSLNAAPAPAPRSGYWNVVFGGTGHFSDAGNPKAVFYGSPGTKYLLQWTYPAVGSCPSISDTVTVSVGYALPHATISTNQTTYCSSQSIKLEASGASDGQYRWIQNPSVTTAALTLGTLSAGSYTYSVYFTDGHCNSDTATVSFTVSAPPTQARTGKNQTICSGSAIPAGNTVAAGETGHWAIKSGAGGVFADTTDPNSSFSGRPGTTYLLEWSIRNTGVCPPTSALLTVVILPALPAPQLLYDSGVCVDKSLTVTASLSPKGTYFYRLRRPDDTVIVLTTTQAKITLDQWITEKQTGLWTLEASVQNGTCYGPVTVKKFNVYAVPKAFAGHDTTLFPNDDVLFKSAGAYKRTWRVVKATGDYDLNAPGDTGQASFRAKPGNYTLYLTVTGPGGCGTEDSVHFLVDTKIHLYNVFTPNRDMVNEVWNIGSIGLYPHASLTIYNRWNEPVYTAENGYTVPWDGTYKGNNLPAGGYIYELILKPGAEPIIGTITLVR